MNFLKKPISIVLIIAIALIDVKIVVDYEIIRPTEKYNIIDKKKTVAQVIDFSSVHPEEAMQIVFVEDENSVELSEEEVEKIETEAEEKIEAMSLAQTETNQEIVEQTQEIVQEPEQTQEQPSETLPEQPTEEITTTSSNDIVSTALQYKGYSYVSGGSSPETGFDCSGFTKYIYGLFGINLNRVAADQADNGTPISKEELQPGDLLLFSYYGSSSIGHTGIYIGDGNFIHAANSTRGVVIDTIESGYYLDNYIGARRVN